MTIKETIKSLIALKQEEIPVSYNPRDVELPIDSKKIITTVGVRRCGKSTLMELLILMMELSISLNHMKD